MRKILWIAFYEARMSSRGWRFWLLLALISGISYFARRDYIRYSENGFFLQSGFSFQHPSFWLMISILAMGAVALSLDICSRMRRNRMDKILFPLPFGAMQLMWGRLIGVLVIIIPVSFIGFFSLGLWQSLYGHGTIVWQPYIVAFCLLVLPVILPVTALAITMRTFFKHDFAALLFGGLIGCVGGFLGYKAGIFIDVPAVLSLLVNSSPTIGVRISLSSFWIHCLIHLVLSVAILMMAPLYLRRQEPQRWITRHGGARALIGMPTIMTWVTNLRFDKHLGWHYRISMVLVIILSTTSVLWAAFRYQDIHAMFVNQDAIQVNTASQKLPDITLDALHYTIDIQPDENYERLELQSSLSFTTNQETKFFGIELSPKCKIVSIKLDGEALASYLREGELVRLFPITPITANTEHQLELTYRTNPKYYHPRFTTLNGVWYPVLWKKIKNNAGKWIDVGNDIFTASLTLNLRSWQQGAFAGKRISAHVEEKQRTEKWETLYPVDQLQIFWGAYKSVHEKEKGYDIQFFHLPGHDYQAQVYLEEVKEQREYVTEKLGQLPFPQLTFIETPYEHNLEWRYDSMGPWGLRGLRVRGQSDFKMNMPGLIIVPENRLSYLHENMWSIHRFDRDPRLIPFYQLVKPTLERLHAQFYNKLISAYFEHSLHPTGEMAFWIDDYLSSYASKLLEKNLWVKRWILNYDVGTSPNLPLSVALRSTLLEMHRSGDHRQLARVRGEGLFRMIHHLLGEDQWWAMLREMFQRYRFKVIPVEEFLPFVESFYGKPLDWFIEDWINGTALPEYQITLAEARVVEDKEKNRINYEVRIQVKNHGTGRMSIPIFLETEMDYIYRDLVIGAGEEKTLSLTVPHRPSFAMVDPEKWIIQKPFKEEGKKIRGHSEARVYIIGDDSKSTVRRRQERRGGRGRRWH